MATVLSLRPEQASLDLARRLAESGHEAVCAPLLAIEPTGLAPPDHRHCVAAVATSMHALEPLRAIGWEHPVHTVGSQTTARASTLGLDAVPNPPSGDAAGLADALVHRLAPGTALLYPRGDTVAFPMNERLTSAGLECVEWIVYRTQERAIDSPDLTSAFRRLTAGGIDAVLLTSPSLARAFARTAPDPPRRTRLLAMSARVARALPDSLTARAEVAAEPNMTALLSLVDKPEASC